MEPMLDLVKKSACAATGCPTFAEVATLALARSFIRKGRRLDARRLLRAFAKTNGATPRISALWQTLLD